MPRAVRCVALCLLAVALAGCSMYSPLPRQGALTTTPLGQAETWARAVETLVGELGRASTCPEQCRLSDRICEAAEKLCEIAAEHPDDLALAARCATARGHCETARARCQTCATAP